MGVPLRRHARLGWAAATLVLVACGGSASRATPTPDPAEELVIVTATPGTPLPRTPTPGLDRRYVVREGDTLSAIAARFDVSEEAIQQANGIDNPNSLFAGQELVIPAPEP